MVQFLAAHVQLVNAALNAAMIIIWFVYLQIFLISHRRQVRSLIHIDLGTAEGSQKRCLVTNLSAQAIYVQGIAADLGQDGHTSRMIVTEREEIGLDDVEDPMARTNRGTLQPGETRDIGSLEDLIRRAQIRLDEEWTSDQIDNVTITVVAISGQVERIIGASKNFYVDRGASGLQFSPENILTQQI
ncbi:hypothetical protein A3731_22185, partial [Roseovarius sp. HI0049]